MSTQESPPHPSTQEQTGVGSSKEHASAAVSQLAPASPVPPPAQAAHRLSQEESQQKGSMLHTAL